MTKIHSKDFRVTEGSELNLDKWPTKVDPVYKSKGQYKKLLEDHVARLSSQQQLLYASNRHAVLLIFQAMDAAGKDGAIRHVMSGVNPQGCVCSPLAGQGAGKLHQTSDARRFGSLRVCTAMLAITPRGPTKSQQSKKVAGTPTASIPISTARPPVTTARSCGSRRTRPRRLVPEALGGATCGQMDRGDAEEGAKRREGCFHAFGDAEIAVGPCL